MFKISDNTIYVEINVHIHPSHITHHPSPITHHPSPITRSGFIAQEVNTVFPKETTWITLENKGQEYIDINGNLFFPLTVSPTEMIPYIIRSVQELAEKNIILTQQLDMQQTQITSQQTEITELQSQITQLLQRLTAAGIP